MSFDWSTIATIIGSLFGGGVMGIIVKSIAERGKTNAEATNTNIKSLLEIDQRMNERMANLEARVANLEEENYKLKSEKLKLEKETHKLKTRIIELEEENKILIEENVALRATIENKEKEVS